MMENEDRLITCAFALKPETRDALTSIAKRAERNFSSYVRLICERHVAAVERAQQAKVGRQRATA